ncbi:MAG: hypothetical protein KatS3mg105_3348 [Gemmatales bacterium]|nr:MAG: hypothetical protein KatS3mg105_3348 [Gemmatales bacterium]
MRTILPAVAMGLIIFIGIAVYLRLSGQFVGKAESSLLTYFAIVVAVAMVGSQFLVPEMLGKSVVRQLARGRPSTPDIAAEYDRPRLLSAYQTRFILSVALLEGAGFLLTISYLVEGSLICIMSAALIALGILAKFPTREGLEQWLSAQEEELEQLRKGF